MKKDLLSQWVDGKCLPVSSKNKLQLAFSSSNPFPHLELKDFFREDRAKKLLLALSKEKFIPKEADLLKLKQTNDLASSSVRELQGFRKFLLSEDFMSYMESITGFTLKRGVIDLAGSLYEDTDYLLCHDDQLEGRKIAFLFYLSSMGKNEGGSLGLLDTQLRTVKRIVPRFNTFAFFEVSPHSFHEVEEMLKDRQRITLGGWFHGR